MRYLHRTIAALKSGLRSLLPSCRDAVRVQSDALDRPLSITQRLGLGVHLLMCKWCRRYGRQIRLLRRLAREHSDEATPTAGPTLSPEARARIKQRLRNEG